MSPASTDPWDQPVYPTSYTAVPKRKSQPQAVRDDWDDDDDEEEEDSAKVWQEANQKAPMPELIISPSSTGQRVVPPPPTAFQPTLRILKRPSPSLSASTSTTSLASSQTRSTLAEREAQYQEARNRIFGENHEGCSPPPAQEGYEGSTLPGNKSDKTTQRQVVGIVRDPISGPSDPTSPDQNRTSKGFSERRRGKKQVDGI